ncbi:Zinc finger CW-type PWWP domain protein 1 like protein [Argiope bruennichi]|uniref:Zinc finger CW-type PWWP domain protein 1 like protein n=1 Tax=Argiope bruennichi TaxID=94029 RepID=A0A8T0E055_ARGBR|nr:Zinc finger CW-type PWWP domain protein 1 like protein [Argiope bruennichi]
MLGFEANDHESSSGSSFLEEKYAPGTLVWAKVFGYPYWPAMIEDDPDEGTHSKDLTTAPKFHVVFFDTPTSRAWLALHISDNFTYHLRYRKIENLYRRKIQKCCIGG